MDWLADTERVKIDQEEVSVQIAGQRWCYATGMSYSERGTFPENIALCVAGKWMLLCDVLLIVTGPRRGERIYRAIRTDDCPYVDDVKTVG